MDALVMCGGEGTRLGRGEKPLLDVGGRPMLDRMVDALANSRVDTAHAVVSPNAPETTERARDVLGLSVIETPGAGYVADLDRALDRVESPVMTVVADLPLLDATTVDAVLDGWDGGSVTVCVPAARKRELGVSVDTTFVHNGRELAPSGVNVVSVDTDEIMIRESDRLAVNVNRPRDAQVAEALYGYDGP